MPPQASMLFDPETKLLKRLVIRSILRRDIGAGVCRRPDVDNVAKAVLDALTGVVFHDDSQVERLLVTKVVGDRPRISVTARPMAREKIAEIA